MPCSPLASPFASAEAFRSAFTDGLQRLLGEDALGAFILVLANASFDRAIFDQLHDALGARFADWAEHFRQHYRAGQEVEQPDDDVLVCLKLIALGFEHIGATEFGRAGSWELQFNLLRAFRPNRISYAPVPWSGGFAWYEMAGGVTTFSKQDFLALDETTIGDELRRVGSPKENDR